MSQKSSQSLPLNGVVSLFLLYVIWGSTYLAIRLTVRAGGGFPPFRMAAMRTIAAAVLLLLFCLAKKQRVLPSVRELKVLIPCGMLLWIGGNGLVTYAMEQADSGFAALSVGTLPIWTALIEALMFRRRPSLLFAAALLVGFGGLAVLHWHALNSAMGTPVSSVAALIMAPIFWATGSVIQKKYSVSLAPAASGAWQQLAGCAGFVALSLVLNEPDISPSPVAWGAFAYLVLAGGVVAFTAYMVALQTLPAGLATTYAYVNPVIAIFLGWIFLGEPVENETYLSCAMIIAGVAGVFRWRQSAPAEGAAQK